MSEESRFLYRPTLSIKILPFTLTEHIIFSVDFEISCVSQHLAKVVSGGITPRYPCSKSTFGRKLSIFRPAYEFMIWLIYFKRNLNSFTKS